jgi:PTH1 family peptidyl-tRNA hydrolase
VVVDDLNLPLGGLRVREQGSAGGHNGLRDIEARIGQGYPRLRLGIGAPPGAGAQQIDHVLGRFSDGERPAAEAMIARAADAVLAWLEHGLAAAARLNVVPKPPAPPQPPPAPAPAATP